MCTPCDPRTSCFNCPRSPASTIQRIRSGGNRLACNSSEEGRCLISSTEQKPTSGQRWLPLASVARLNWGTEDAIPPNCGSTCDRICNQVVRGGASTAGATGDGCKADTFCHLFRPG